VVQPRITSRKGKAKAAASQVSASKAAAAAPRQRKTKPLKEAAANIASSLNKPVEKPARQKSRKTASPQAAILRVKKPRKQTRQASGETLKPRIGRKRRATISLVGKEEHRCPFCLEEVNPRDPAGVVTCPICHTMHHKSCWDVTGTCQVPHSQS
jgi:ribosomal protein L37AE/L43A